MDTRPWEKFESTKYLALMQSHPNNIVGQWFRVWCTLASSKTRWTKTGDMETWCRILGENERLTKRFITYASMNISNLRITTKNSSQGRMVTITEDYYKAVDKDIQLKKKGKAKYSKTDVSNHRTKLKGRVINAYHPNKRTKQLDTFNKEFNKVMAEANRIFNTNEQKIEAEIIKCEEILMHIKWLSTTPEWDGEGTFVLGIGNFMQNRAWEYEHGTYADKLKSGKDKIVEQFETDMVDYE